MSKIFTQARRHQMIVELVDHQLGLELMSLQHSRCMFGQIPLTKEEISAAEEYYYYNTYSEMDKLSDADLWQKWMDVQGKEFGSEDVTRGEAQ